MTWRFDALDVFEYRLSLERMHPKYAAIRRIYKVIAAAPQSRSSFIHDLKNEFRILG